jgi:predicted transcriptional regulator
MAITKRTSAVKVLLSEDMHEKLRVLADNLGQTPATLASIAVSQYVHQQTVSVGAAERAMTGFFEKLAPDLARMLEEPKKPVKAPAKARQMRIEG